MAVQVMERQKNNTLGMLGSLATIAGMATGTGWLTTLGSGLGAMNSMANGQTPTAEQSGGLSDLLKSLKDSIVGWINPAKNDEQTAKDLAKKWSPYLNGGYSGWPTYTGGDSRWL